MNFLSKFLVFIAVFVSSSFAAATLTAPTFALDDVAVVAGALLTGLAGFWAIKKGISLTRI
jgi:hypothetical protein